MYVETKSLVVSSATTLHLLKVPREVRDNIYSFIHYPKQFHAYVGGPSAHCANIVVDNHPFSTLFSVCSRLREEYLEYLKSQSSDGLRATIFLAWAKPAGSNWFADDDSIGEVSWEHWKKCIDPEMTEKVKFIFGRLKHLVVVLEQDSYIQRWYAPTFRHPLQDLETTFGSFNSYPSLLSVKIGSAYRLEAETYHQGYEAMIRLLDSDHMMDPTPLLSSIDFTGFRLAQGCTAYKAYRNVAHFPAIKCECISNFDIKRLDLLLFIRDGENASNHEEWTPEQIPFIFPARYLASNNDMKCGILWHDNIEFGFNEIGKTPIKGKAWNELHDVLL